MIDAALSNISSSIESKAMGWIYFTGSFKSTSHLLKRYISSLKLTKIFVKFSDLSSVGNFSLINSLSLSSSIIFPFPHNSSLLSNVATWLFAFKYLFGFWRSTACTTWINFRLYSLKVYCLSTNSSFFLFPL